jgi:arabinose-5-phosphate isomerase
MASVNALHGDIGMIGQDDILVILSKSGESQELIGLVPYVRSKGATVVAVTSKGNSRLAALSDMSIVLPMERELCAFNLVPTISAQVQMIFGDMVTVALMHRRNFSLQAYAENHPSGKIGRKIATKVRDLMLSGEELPLVCPNDRLMDVLVELSSKRCGAVLIVSKELQLQGIFTDGDLGRTLNSLGAEALQLPISQLMTRSPRTISSEALAIAALEEMEADPRRPITFLAVVDAANRLLGAIKLHDLIQAGFQQGDRAQVEAPSLPLEPTAGLIAATLPNG